MARLALLESDPLVAETLAAALIGAGHEIVSGDATGCDGIIAGVGAEVPPDGAVLWLIPPGGAVPAGGMTLEKPVRLPVLLEAVTRLLARRGREPRIWGGYRLDPVLRQLVLPDGQSVRLTEIEARLLDRLAQAGAAGLTRAGLLEAVWGWRSDLETHTVETHLYRLRRKLKAAGEGALLDRQGGAVRLNHL